MAIEPINAASLRPDLMAPRRQNAADRGAAPTAVSAHASTPAAAAPPPRMNAQLQQALQSGRETSALLSALPGPNMSFFKPPAPPLQSARLQGQPAAGAAGAAGPGQRPNLQLMETMQTGRETSTLLSSLMGPNQRAFSAPTPPAFAASRAFAAAPAGPGGNAGAVAAGPLPRAGARLLETEQAGRVSSTLLSGLTTPPAQPGGSFGVSSFAQPVVGFASGDSLAAMRTAEEVIQAVGSARPSAQNMRIATEAYRMESQAQQDYIRRAAGGAGGQGMWEWFA
ncbi:MAG: hypothetical protein ABSG17_15465 [Spirochaetia bacterium]|jgi:hypothetical protein